MVQQERIVSRSDVAAALGLLSRLPVRVDMAAARARGPRAAWAFSVAGLALGLIAALAGTLAGALGLPPPLAAAVVLVVLVVTTGAMHEDGLADSADGLWGGWDRERRLAIMKDSRTGAYGVIALVLSLLMRWAALVPLIEAGWLWAAVLAAACLSRAAMVGVMAALPNARADGLSRGVGRPPAAAALVAGALALALALAAAGLAAVPAALGAGAAALGWAAVARAKIGGQTGDILGATQQLTEIVVLLVLVALLP